MTIERRIAHPLTDVLAGLPGLRLPFVAVVDDVLTKDECGALIARIEAAEPEVATITRGGGRTELNTRIRNNDRAMFDDADLARTLFERLRDAVPATWDGRVACGWNERFRCYRYREGQRFAPHFDGCFRRNDVECSEITAMVYLNEGCAGGETSFLDWETKIVPKIGRALLFQHNILHEGSLVSGGVKYVLRSDVMYREPSGSV
jgi:prolyl 4-hydroxylase